MQKQNVQIQAIEEVDAREVARAVQLASSYDSSLHLLFENTSVNLKSIMGMMALHLVRGDEITLIAEGSDETQAMRGLKAFFCGAQ